MRLTNVGSQYLAADLDRNGQHDNQTRSMLRTPQRFPRAGSQSYPTPAASAEPDGTTVTHIGSRQPDGAADGNWIQTDPARASSCSSGSTRPSRRP
jgi:hypothetical protein